MNSKYNFWSLLGIMLLTVFSVQAQPNTAKFNKEEFQSVIKKVGELTSSIAEEVVNAMKEVDFSEITREAEKLAHVSEIEGRRISEELGKIDFSAIERQGEIIGEEISKIDFENIWEESTPAFNHLYQQEKVIEKVYKIGAQDKLSIDNRYGKIKINNWNRNEFKVVVTITAGESSEKRAREAIERVEIQESKSGNQVSFKTVISSAESNWISSFLGSSGNHELKIDYEVYMPAGNELTLANSYGAIETGDRDGKFTVSVKYGSLKTGELRSKSNSIAASYSKATIGYLNEGNVAMKYGSLSISEADKVTASLSYSGNSDIGIVNNRANVSLKYSGGFKLGLGSRIHQANVEAAYSSLAIKPSPSAAFDFSTAVSYGSFDYDKAITKISHETKGNTSSSYSGYWNKSGNNTVNISAKYGSVTMK